MNLNLYPDYTFFSKYAHLKKIDFILVFEINITVYQIK